MARKRDKHDKHDMAGIIGRSPGQFEAGLTAAAGVATARGPFRNVLVAGMGGSWMAAALVAEAGLARVPIRIHRSYDLPEGLDRSNTLVIASSFSGSTEETLSAYDAARKGRFRLVGIASGGELLARCEHDGVPFVRIPADPPDMQPRCATGYGVGILVGILARSGLAAKGATKTVAGLGPLLAASMQAARRRAKRLIPALRQATPVVYASQRYATVARIWKIKLNENAKTPAFWNVFPELNHNEMTGWMKRQGVFHLVFLTDPEEDPRVLARQKIARNLLGKHGLRSSQITIEGSSLAEKVFSTLLVGDWTSYEQALALGVDPTPVEMVEQFKRLLKRIDD